MQNRKIVSAMMGAALSVLNLSSAIVPVYAEKSNFIFPTVSTFTKEEKVDIVEENVPVEVVDTTIKNSKTISKEQKEEMLLLARKLADRKKEKGFTKEGIFQEGDRNTKDISEETKPVVEENVNLQEDSLISHKESKTEEVMETKSALEIESTEASSVTQESKPVDIEVKDENKKIEVNTIESEKKSENVSQTLDEVNRENTENIDADEEKHEIIENSNLEEHEEVQVNETVIAEEERKTETEVMLDEIISEDVVEQTVDTENMEEEKIDLELNHNICQLQHVNIEECPIYDYPSENIGEIIEYLPMKANLFVIGDSINDFYSVSYNEEVYYVKKDNFVRILSEDFEDVEAKVVYLNQETDILNLPENQSSMVMIEDLRTNTMITIIGEHEEGYVKVMLDDLVGYIAEEYCSETKLLPKTSEIQMKIAENAADPDTAPCESGYCAAWVASIYHSAGLYRDKGLGNAIDFWTKWGTNDGITSSTRYDNIPVGAVVVGSGSGGDLGNTYGHVGIYLGDGLVAENIGKHNVVSLEKWMEKNIGVCDGYHGYIGWVFPFNEDLQDY